MDIEQAQRFVSRERARWFFGAAKLPDGQLLRRRERLYNALTMIFGFALLIGYFLLPTLWAEFGDYAAIYGTWATLTGLFFAAVGYGVTANQCRDVRQFLDSHFHAPSA